MPRWNVGPLGVAPIFRWRDLPLLIGPGMVMGASAIGGGEWLTGPSVSARYGGALLWLATLSIVFQVFYNVEISRYTLYSGEPIFSGKFRIPPGPILWVFVYLLLDFGSFLPYLVSNAAVPLASMILGHIPDKSPGHPEVAFLFQVKVGLWFLLMVPLIFGGRIYDSLKIVTVFKLIVVSAFLLFLTVGYSTLETWAEIWSGFFRFGTLPFYSTTGEGTELLNVPQLLWTGKDIPRLDLSLVGMITAMAAIAGNGGLTNTPISNFTREQGWGMGKEVGSIPSIVGGRKLSLSHVGSIFLINRDSLARWKGWLRHIQRDQFLVWFPACFLGMALPSMLSIQFLKNAVVPEDKNLVAAMTANGVAQAVGPTLGPLFWNLTMFTGFLVLITSGVVTVDGVLRRWVDLIWTASARVRTWDPRSIGRMYFWCLVIYATGGLFALAYAPEQALIVWATTIYNYALGFSCWHTLIVNTWLLPKEIRPGWVVRPLLVLGGVFFLAIAVLTTADNLGYFKLTLPGVKAVELKPEVIEKFQLPAETKGVAIETVKNGSLSETLGLRPGDVIQRIGTHPITKLKEYEGAIGRSDLSTDTPIQYLRDGRSAEVILKVPQ